MVAHSTSVRSLGYRRPSSLYFSRSSAVHMLISLPGSPTVADGFQSNRLSDPGRAAMLRIAASLMLRSALCTASAPATSSFRGSIHTPHDCCVRFAVAVAGHRATLATGRALPLTRTGLSPVGSRQLRLAHAKSSLEAVFTIHEPRVLQPGRCKRPGAVTG